LEHAFPFAQTQLEMLRAVSGVVRAEAAGSLRRMRETVGDIDILVAAADSAPVMDAFTRQPGVARVLGQGTTKASVEFTNGMRAQVWVHPPEKYGTALQYATGSKDHNVAMRELALSQGLSLSEHALTRVDSGAELHFATEEAVYQHLGIPWVPPELREDRGEMDAARKNALPSRLQTAQIIGSLHNHSTWSDGKATIREMAEAAVARGYKILAITDHSHGLGITQGVSPDDLLRQRAEIDAVQAEFGDTLTLLQGVELEIKADGTLDFDDDVLAALDIVVASLHVSLRQPRAQVTERALNAIHNPHVDILGHPTGRIIPDREGADLDMEQILAAAAQTNTALEINANPRRLDLSDIYARRAVEMGIKISINTDAHAPDHFDLLHFGVAVARRGWVEPQHVINCWDAETLLRWLEQRK
jgi:DNA polymerase (family 10)